MLKVCGNKIVDGKNPVRLKGVNFGGWLMMEGYFMHAPNQAVQIFKKDFEDRLGKKALLEFEKKFTDTFIREEDFADVARMGCNCIRLPFNCRLIEAAPYEYNLDGVVYLDKSIRWAEKYGLKIILDLHAVPGAQNHDWHGDSLGLAELWTKRENQKRTFALWKFLADRYRDNSVIAGYDLLNEAVVADPKKLNKFYAELIREIRKVDRNHILFIEGNSWAMDLKCLDDFEDDNWAYSIHFYHPLDFTFNFVPQLHYPLRSQKSIFGKASLKKLVRDYKMFAGKRPVFVGEFGINSRAGKYGDDLWLLDVLDCFEDAGLHWTYWTYKALKNHMFPDGIYSYFPNDLWVNRHGPKTGWETWAYLWPKYKKEIVRSWRTEYFDVNESVMKVLTKYF